MGGPFGNRQRLKEIKQGRKHKVDRNKVPVVVFVANLLRVVHHAMTRLVWVEPLRARRDDASHGNGSGGVSLVGGRIPGVRVHWWQLGRVVVEDRAIDLLSDEVLALGVALPALRVWWTLRRVAGGLCLRSCGHKRRCRCRLGLHVIAGVGWRIVVALLWLHVRGVRLVVELLLRIVVWLEWLRMDGAFGDLRQRRAGRLLGLE